MPIIDGEELSYAELAAQAGVTERAMRHRIEKHPDWGKDLLTRKSVNGNARRFVSVDGVTYTLAEWARMHGILPQTAGYRWDIGERDPYLLVGQPGKLPPISEDLKEHLKATRFARAGMEHEWEIACELIGISKHLAPKLKEYMEAISA